MPMLLPLRLFSLPEPLFAFRLLFAHAIIDIRLMIFRAADIFDDVALMIAASFRRWLPAMPAAFDTAIDAPDTLITASCRCFCFYFYAARAPAGAADSFAACHFASRHAITSFSSPLAAREAKMLIDRRCQMLMPPGRCRQLHAFSPYGAEELSLMLTLLIYY
jgi:hypothetical protein